MQISAKKIVSKNNGNIAPAEEQLFFRQSLKTKVFMEYLEASGNPSLKDKFRYDKCYISTGENRDWGKTNPPPTI